MKLLKSIALGALALAAVSVASATTVKVTGSTAFRKALYASIINQLGSGTVKVAYIGSALNGANQATFTNGTDTVQCAMAGSVGGINWVVNDVNVATSIGGNTAQAWIKESVAAAGATAAIGAGPGFTITGGTGQSSVANFLIANPAGFDAASIADFCMSDSLQDSTPYDSASTGITLTQAQGGGLGVVQFLMAKGKLRTGADAAFTAAYARLTNISALGFQNLSNLGAVPLSFFTGVDTDSAYNVVLVGRDNDSGTRLATTFETGIGSVDTPMSQFRAFDGANDVGSGTGTTVKTMTGVGATAGYSSGGHVKKVLDAAVDATAVFGGKPFIVVAYVGTGDAPTDSTQRLTYQGVAQSDLATKAGQYTFWTYQQAYYKITDAAKISIIEAVAGNILTSKATAAAGILLGDMTVSRGAEGTVVF